jgi:hypothetical protein
VTDDRLAAWLTALVDAAAPGGAPARASLSPEEALVRRSTPSGAELALAGDVVVKLHHPRTDAAALAARLRAVTVPGLAPLWVQPVQREPLLAPDGRLASVWPRVEVLVEGADNHPWAEAGDLLAALHGAEPDGTLTKALPAQGGPARVERALRRVRELDHAARPDLVDLGGRLLADVTTERPRPTVVHGDWHLGQLAHTPEGLRLLDVDDLGVGDPAWDLSRPAGFWAAGVLDDAAWTTFLEAYREAGGPAVPAQGDPWAHLDLPARCAVFVATVRALTVQPAHSGDSADALLEACSRM